jgi:Na+/phosphate symporter
MFFLIFTAFLLLKRFELLPFYSDAASPLTVAMSHTLFNIIATLILFPFGRSLELLATKSVREGK